MAPLTVAEGRICRKAYVIGTEDYQYLLIVLEKAIRFHIFVILFIKHAMIVAPLVEELRKPMHFQEMFHRLRL